ncbi:hypothetical protein Tco_0720090 [Tanacetum coccineum]
MNETNSSFRTTEVERLSVLSMVTAYASRAVATLLATSCRMAAWVITNATDVDFGGSVVDLTGDEDPTDEDRDIRMGNSTGVSASLGGKILLRGKKCQESNIGDSDNIGDRGKIVGGVIGACGGIGERACEAKRSLVKSSEKLGEVFPGGDGK